MSAELSRSLVVMSVHALSAAFRERIQREVAGGEPVTYVLVSSLRRLGAIGALRELRRIQPTLLLIAHEDADSEALVPILTCVGVVTRAKRIEIAGPSLTRTPISRPGAVGSLAALVGGSLAGLAAYSRAKREVRELDAAPAAPPAVPRGNDVLYINANLWFGVKAGGSVGHIAGVANEMQRRGMRVEYAALSDSPQIDAGVARAQMQPHVNHGLPPELNSYRFGQSVYEQIKRLRAKRTPDFIYQRMSVCNYTGAQLSREMGVPLVLEYNGSEVWTAKHWGRPMTFETLAMDSERVSLKHAQLVVTVSQALEDQLIEAGVPREKIVTYPNCVDADVFDPARFSAADRSALLEKHKLDPSGVIVGFIGTFGKWHGVEVLAEAIRRMLDADGDWVRRHKVGFLIVGDGQGMPAIRKTLGSYMDGNHVRLTGLVPQADAPKYLAAADILVSPHVPNPDGTAFFGSPTKLFEYMAMERAIVASDLDQIGKVLERCVRASDLPQGAPQPGDDARAILTTPGSVEELIAGIRFTVEQPAWRRHLGANARREVLAHYTWSHHVDAIMAALSGHGRKPGQARLVPVG